jgi:hypothetical protein
VPRIRSIKPEFFQHAELFDAERVSGLPLRVAFAGLWTQSDREGRFEWRSRQLKLNVLPYDELDFDQVLEVLAETGFVVRYEVDGKAYGYIPSWLKHQCPNVREPVGTIPAPCGNSTDTVPVPWEGKGKERKGREVPSADEPPPGLDLVSWKRWTDYRSQIRRPLKPVSIPAAQRELAAFGADQAAVVEQSVAHGWQGLFDLKSRANGGKPATAAPKQPPTDEQISEARRNAIADNARTAQRLGLAASKAMP